MRQARPRVLGPVVDEETRCIHYGTPLDVIAIKFACCRAFYPCHFCHEESADHDAAQWPVHARGEQAVLCGVCGHRLTIAEYLDTEACPACTTSFNPGCRLHTDFYFQT